MLAIIIWELPGLVFGQDYTLPAGRAPIVAFKGTEAHVTLRAEQREGISGGTAGAMDTVAVRGSVPQSSRVSATSQTAIAFDRGSKLPVFDKPTVLLVHVSNHRSNQQPFGGSPGPCANELPSSSGEAMLWKPCGRAGPFSSPCVRRTWCRTPRTATRRGSESTRIDKLFGTTRDDEFIVVSTGFIWIYMVISED